MIEQNRSRNLAASLRAGFFLTLVFGSIYSGLAAGPEQISDSAMAQIAAMMQEKASRSPVEHKLDSQFVFQLKQNRGQAIAAGVTHLKPDVHFEPDGRVLVDIDATVTTNLLAQIERSGGTVINHFPQFRAIRARVPLEQLETLAGSADVKFIRRASRAMTNTGSVDSEGDTTHRAAFARNNFGINGQGVKVGVLSDSVDYLYASQASGDLGDVTVLPGQDGYGAGEGTAMLEIVHDLAPGAQLYFATAFNGEASFAQNILNLRSNGCDVIIDDVYYFDEPVFQDGVIAQAVNAVTTDGAFYFSAAGNDGNFKDGTSGTWEGDFLDSGQPVPPILRANGVGGKVHSFGVTNYDTVISGGQGVDLFWDDPLGVSTNDYDLFLLDATGNYVEASSLNPQTGTQDPYENISYVYPGERVVIVKSSGDSRFLHLVTSRGKLSYRTAGATRGHSTAANAFSVAAVNALDSYPGPFTGGGANPVETFSSDGPRRVFFNADGSAITPGNFSSTGGAVRQKPDIAAADGVMTYVWGVYTGYGPFYGTSAAAPHAGAIAALLLSYDHTLTANQIRAALTNSALDNEAPGFDSNSGAGIVMAEPALETLPPRPVILAGSVALVNESCPNGAIDPGETVTVALSLTNPGVAGTSNLVATLLDTGGVTYASAPQSYGALPAHGGTGTQLFTYIATGDCGGTNIVTLQLQDGALNLGTVSFIFQLGQHKIVLLENFDSVTSPNLPAGWSTASSGAGVPWRTTNSWSDTVPNSVFIADPGTTSDKSLISPVFHIDSTSAQVSFVQNGGLMAWGYSGGVLEISTNGGLYQDVVAAGGSFVTNGYNGSIYSGYGNPLGDYRSVWNGIVGPTIVNLPASAAGRDVRLRWRFATGSYSFGNPYGWYIDSVQVTDGFTCCAPVTNNVVVGVGDTPDPVVLGGILTYTINVENTGPGTATGVNVTDLLPASFTLQSISLSRGVYPGPGQNGGGALHFNISSLASGATETITISGTADTVGLLTNRVSIARTDGGLITSSNATVVTSVILPAISINDVLVMEDATNAIFSVSLSPAPAANAFVRFATTNLTALAGTNYFSTTGLLTFAPGVTNQTVTVTVMDDLVDAPDLTFAVNLSNATNGVITKAQGTGTIINVDPEPYLSVSDATVVKPNSGTTNAVFNFSLSRASGFTVSAYYYTVDGSAIGGFDYTPTNNYLTFLPGQTNLSVRVLVKNHVSARPSQSFFMFLDPYSASYAKIARGTGVGTILTSFPGQLDHFSLDPIPSPQSNGLPFSVTIRAKDYLEGAASNFNGTVGLVARGAQVKALPPGTVVPYFTDNNSSDSGPAAPITRAGFTPLHVNDISTLVLSDYSVLFIDEEDNGVVSSSLRGRLAAIQAWVNSGGHLIVHDRSAGDLSPNPFLLGTTGITTVRDETSNIDVIPPGANLVVSGPFGTINNTTLDGGNSSAHGYVPQNQVPHSAFPILSIGGNPNQVVDFSYPLGQGQIYYSSIPLDYYLDGNGNSGLNAAMQNIYTPNVLSYVANLASGVPVLITPTNSGTFTNGIWSGSVTVQQLATNATLFANDGAEHSGQSNPFDVVPAPGQVTHFVWSPISSPQSIGSPFGVTITAKDYFNNTASNFAGSIALTALAPGTGTNTILVPISPANSGMFANGIWTGAVTVQLLTTNVTLFANDGAGHSGQSNPFNVVPVHGQVTHFVWSPIASPVAISNSFGAIITALDYFNNTASNFTGPVTISASLPGAVNPTTSSPFTNGVSFNSVLITRLATNLTLLANDGLGHTGLSNPFNVVPAPGQVTHFVWSPIASPEPVSNYFGATITALDYFNNTASNFTGPVTVSAFALMANGATTNTMLGNANHQTSFYASDETFGQSFTPTNSITVTHVRYNFGSKVSIWANDGTLLVSTNITSTPGTWVETPLATPLQLSAGQTYYLTVYVPTSTNNSFLAYFRSDMPTNFPDGFIDHAYYSVGDGFPIYDDYVRWFLVDIRYIGLGLTEVPVAVSPTTSSPFTNGVSSNNVLITQLATNLTLLANDGLGHSGSSNPFNVGYVSGYLDHFAWSAIASPQTNAAPFTATVTALDHFNGIATNFNGAATLTVTGSPASPSIAPASGNFVHGVWSGPVTLMPAASNAVLRVADGLNRTAASNPFNVVDPPLLPPVLQSTCVSNNTFLFGWSAVPGHLYQVQYKTNLTQAEWLNLGDPVNASNVNLWLVQPIGPDPQRFFRVQLQ